VWGTPPVMRRGYRTPPAPSPGVGGDVQPLGSALGNRGDPPMRRTAPVVTVGRPRLGPPRPLIGADLRRRTLMHDTPTRTTAAARPRRRPRLRHALLAVALVASALLLGPPSTTAGAAECGCTGEFVAPKATTAKVAGAAAPDGDTGLSKTGRYRLVNEYDQGAQAGRMRVVRVADGRELVTFPVDGSVNGWGFSPDEDRFVTFGHSSAALYDLASGGGKVLDLNRPATIGFSPKGTYAVAVWPEGNTAYASVHHAANGQLVRIGGSDRIQGSLCLGSGPDDTTLFVENTPARTSSLYALPSATRLYQRFGNPSSVGYSPDGSHVSVITLDGSQVHVAVVRTADGTIAYQTSFTASAPPIISEPDEKTGELKLDPQEAGGLGFSPDGGSYLVGDGSTSRVTVVDLASGDEVLVRTNISGRATWAFSPCGHMFTLVTQALPTSRPRVEVRSTADGSLLGETTTPPGAATVRATVDELAV